MVTGVADIVDGQSVGSRCAVSAYIEHHARLRRKTFARVPRCWLQANRHTVLLREYPLKQGRRQDCPAEMEWLSTLSATLDIELRIDEE